MRCILIYLLIGLVAKAYANQPLTDDELSAKINYLSAQNSSIFLTTPSPNRFQEISEKYYPNQDLSDKPNVYIGMTAFDVKHNSNWGEPSEISTLINQFGTQEIWIYGNWDKVLHLTDGIVTHIQY